MAETAAVVKRFTGTVPWADLDPSVIVLLRDHSGEDREFQCMGRCLACGSYTWRSKDGRDDMRGVTTERHTYDPIEASGFDMVGADANICARCGNTQESYEWVVSLARRTLWKYPDAPDASEASGLPAREWPEYDESDVEDVPATYRVNRYYAGDHDREVIATGLTLEEAQEHCNGPETSSQTATSAEARERTARMGDWFDGWESE